MTLEATITCLQVGKAGFLQGLPWELALTPETEGTCSAHSIAPLALAKRGRTLS